MNDDRKGFFIIGLKFKLEGIQFGNFYIIMIEIEYFEEE